MRRMLHSLTDIDFEAQSEFRRHVPLNGFQIRNLRLWKAQLEPAAGEGSIMIVDLTDDDKSRVKPER